MDNLFTFIYPGNTLLLASCENEGKLVWVTKTGSRGHRDLVLSLVWNIIDSVGAREHRI